MVRTYPYQSVFTTKLLPGFELVIGDNSRSRVAEGSSIVVAGDSLDVRGSVKLDDGETAVAGRQTVAPAAQPHALGAKRVRENAVDAAQPGQGRGGKVVIV